MWWRNLSRRNPCYSGYVSDSVSQSRELAGEHKQTFQGMQQSAVTWDRFSGIVVPAQVEMQKRFQSLSTRPKHRAHRKIEVIGKFAHPSHASGDRCGDSAIFVPTTQVWIAREDKAKL